MPSEETNVATRAEWRELGFYAGCDQSAQAWHLVGSAAGLLNFRDRLLSYAADHRLQLTSASGARGSAASSAPLERCTT